MASHREVFVQELGSGQTAADTPHLLSNPVASLSSLLLSSRKTPLRALGHPWPPPYCFHHPLFHKFLGLKLFLCSSLQWTVSPNLRALAVLGTQPGFSTPLPPVWGGERAMGAILEGEQQRPCPRRPRALGFLHLLTTSQAPVKCLVCLGAGFQGQLDVVSSCLLGVLTCCSPTAPCTLRPRCCQLTSRDPVESSPRKSTQALNEQACTSLARPPCWTLWCPHTRPFPTCWRPLSTWCPLSTTHCLQLLSLTDRWSLPAPLAFITSPFPSRRPSGKVAEVTEVNETEKKAGGS